YGPTGILPVEKGNANAEYPNRASLNHLALRETTRWPCCFNSCTLRAIACCPENRMEETTASHATHHPVPAQWARSVFLSLLPVLAVFLGGASSKLADRILCR